MSTVIQITEEAECPACKAVGAPIYKAMIAGNPCPHCGLSAEAARDIWAINVGGPSLKVQAIAQRIQLDQTERDLEACKAILLLVRKHLDSFQPVERTSGG